MKIFRWVLPAVLCLAFVGFSSAQSLDAFFGINTLITGATADGTPKLSGGFFPSFGADFSVLPHNFGIGGQVTWAGTAKDYEGAGVRPVLYSFNLTWNPSSPDSRIRPDAAIGIGGESVRVYTGEYTCSTFGGCTDYVSADHFLVHAGVGVKIYVFKHAFLRPAVDFYNIIHASQYGTLGVVGQPINWQVGVGLGYTLGPSS